MRENVDAESIKQFGNWDRFLAYAENNHSKGLTTLSVGSENWQQRLLFNNVLPGVAGKSAYREFYAKRHTSATSNSAFRQAMTIFRDLKKYSHSFGNGQWDEQIAAVASGNALLVSMGDWGKRGIQESRCSC